MQAIEDKILIYKVKIKKDPEAFGILYDKYAPSIYRYVYFKLSHREEAEDLTSDIFLRVWQYLIDESGEEVTNFQQFVYTVARNKVVDIYRERMRRQTCALEKANEITAPADIREAYAVNEEVEEMFKSIKKLKEEYQEIILLRHVEELSISEIAGILKKSLVSVRVTLHRAVVKLKEVSGE